MRKESKMKLVCINCPKGCEMDVVQEGSTITVTGNSCPRGETYAVSELTNPTRMVTGLVKLAGARRPLPVKTRVAIPKVRISDVTNLLANTTVIPPKRIGDVIIENVCDTGVDIVATANC